MIKILALLFLPLLFCNCARTWVNYPPRVTAGGLDKNGRYVAGKVIAARAVELNGSDSLGHTEFEVTNNGVRYLAAGGIDNSTSTAAGYRTVRHAVGTIGTIATTGLLANAMQASYSSQQGASAATSVAASKAGAAKAAGANATTIRLAEIAAAEKAAAAAAAKAIPAAGQTIPSTIPSIVTPVVP